MNKDLRKIVQALKAQGFVVERSSKGHLMVYRDGVLVAVLAGTASDWRSIRNGIARLRRAGFRWPPKR